MEDVAELTGARKPSRPLTREEGSRAAGFGGKVLRDETSDAFGRDSSDERKAREEGTAS